LFFFFSSNFQFSKSRIFLFEFSHSFVSQQIEEHWRRVFVDVTQMSNLQSEETLKELSGWLTKHQPISVAVNGDSHPYPIMQTIFERTGLCVYTLGHPDAPALTAQVGSFY
jgi:hypothetical protein